MRLNKITSAMMISATAFLWGCGGGGGGGDDSTDTGNNNNSGASTTVPAGLTVSDAEADQRARLLLAQMTLDQKIQLVHGSGMPNLINGYQGVVGAGMYNGVVKGALPDAVGYIPGIAELGIPELNFVDSGSGVFVPKQFATPLPAPILVASSWDLDVAKRAGLRTGLEARTLGFSNPLGGAGVNLARDPRNGRTFEYSGEDPVLAGEMAAARIIGTQSQQVMVSLKHYGMNNSETNRNVSNSIVDEQTMRETEMLGFEIAVQKGNPAYVMCSYNRVNGTHACQSDELMSMLKKDMGFKGVVHSDWGALHTTAVAANAGLDEEQPGIERDDAEMPIAVTFYFGAAFFSSKLSDAVTSGEVPISRIDDMVFRKLRSMISTGVMDNPLPARQAINQVAGTADAYKIATEGMVLLKNEQNTLPLTAMAGKKIAVIGLNADKGVVSGGGSGGSQPYYENQVTDCATDLGTIFANCPVFLGDSPLSAIKKEFPGAQISYFSGEDTAAAETAATDADVTIIFAGNWGNEGADNPSMALPSPETDPTGSFTYDQDALISAVAETAKKTVVVLEVGTAVKMPWLPQVDAVLNAWYPGQQGAYAIADILSGEVNPSGKLPLTFPKDESDLVMVDVPKNLGEYSPLSGLVVVLLEDMLKGIVNGLYGDDAYDNITSIKYDEKLLSNGYKWMDANNIEPLFHFGHGLSYTSFAYSDASSAIASDGSVNVTFTITNTGGRAGAEIAQVYASLPDNVPGHQQPVKKLVGWKKVNLNAGGAQTVTVNVPKKYVSTWNPSASPRQWTLTPGQYDFHISDSADLTSANSLSTSLALGY